MAIEKIELEEFIFYFLVHVMIFWLLVALILIKTDVYMLFY